MAQSTDQPIKRFDTPISFTFQDAQHGIEFILQKIDQNLDAFTDKVPASASIELVYPAIDNTQWTASFWVGMLWLAYEVTGDPKYRRVAEAQLELHKKRLDEQVAIETHDLGFLYTLSCVAAYRITQNEVARDYALRAANYLATRYLEKPQIIQAWSTLNDPQERGRMIIDCLLNLPLLYWASQVTGDQKYHRIAANHARQAARYLVREDGTSFHTYFMNTETGEAIVGKTHQGYADDSCWARGQAWGIYGFPLSYRYTRDWTLIEKTERLADYYLSRLPEDLVPYWDFTFTPANPAERDSSAAPIAACGLLELTKYLPASHPQKQRYENAALAMLQSLTQHYLTRDYPESNGVLLHGVQHKPKEIGVDECCIWGDYYYFEALVRVIKDWQVYW